MIFKAAYPALVTAKPPRRPRATRCVIRREVEVEIPEIAEADAPHVMTVSGGYLRETKDWGGPVPVRLSGGRYYRPLMSAETFGETLSKPLVSNTGELVNPQARIDIYRPIRDKIYRDISGYQGLIMNPWPTLIFDMLRQQNGADIFNGPLREFSASSPKLKLDDEAFYEADTYRDFFLRGLENLAVIDGAIWKETLEPLYCVSLSSLVSVVFPESFHPTPYQSPDIRAFGSADHFFAADQREEALEFLGEHSQKAGEVASMLRTTGDAIEIVDQEGLSGIDTISLGLLAAANDVMARVGRPTDAHTDRGHAAVRQLREAIAECDPPRSFSEGLEDGINAVLELRSENPNFHTRYFTNGSLEHIQLHLRRQDDRNYTVPITRGPSP